MTASLPKPRSMPIRSRKLNIIASSAPSSSFRRRQTTRRGRRRVTSPDEVLVAARCRSRERDESGDRGDDHDDREGPEQHRTAERGNKIWRGPKEHDREHAERHSYDGEQPMGIGAAGNRAVGEAERASDRGAGDKVKGRQRGEVGDESRAQEARQAAPKPAIAAAGNRCD